MTSQVASGIGGIIGGLFGDSDAPYRDYMKEYQGYADRAQGVQNPFLQAGTGAIGNFQQWLGGMQNPSGFINNLMNQYQQSPWAKFQQQQAMRAATNAASASGLTGSTPFAQQLQQNAANISSEDMNQWLQNVLGINTQYGSGNQSLIGTGANSANSLTSLFNTVGQNLGEAAYGARAGENQDFMNTIGGFLQLI